MDSIGLENYKVQHNSTRRWRENKNDSISQFARIICVRGMWQNNVSFFVFTIRFFYNGKYFGGCIPSKLLQK
jgi:RimJ/RimL family protein N-acetyltransferase